ncbi:aa3-type cytochrome c oxidase subunit IV [Primorskyibacter sedentarius]|nr:aa3-type cytochrome c oxidase subunit IV [Primorskyibacter sedentarius]
MAEHKHGSMNIEAQEKTFAGTIRFGINSIIVILVLVVLLALIGA